jgi:hypothetical protein
MWIIVLKINVTAIYPPSRVIYGIIHIIILDIKNNILYILISEE